MYLYLKIGQTMLDNELIILKIFNMVLSRENDMVDTFLWFEIGSKVSQVFLRDV